MIADPKPVEGFFIDCSDNTNDRPSLREADNPIAIKRVSLANIYEDEDVA